MQQCDFCGTKNLEVTKYRCIGKDNGKRVQKTIKICICCDASTNNDWLAEQLGWDEIKEVKKV